MEWENTGISATAYCNESMYIVYDAEPQRGNRRSSVSLCLCIMTDPGNAMQATIIIYRRPSSSSFVFGAHVRRPVAYGRHSCSSCSLAAAGASHNYQLIGIIVVNMCAIVSNRLGLYLQRVCNGPRNQGDCWRVV